MSNIFLRDAVLSDLNRYFEWANDPVVRQNSFNTDPIPYDDHVNWFNNAIERKDVHLFVLMDNDMPVGQIRLNIKESVAEISYSIDSKYRGKGYGSLMISLLKEKVKKEMPDIKALQARVKPDNIASKKVFNQQGFSEKESVYELCVINP